MLLTEKNIVHYLLDCGLVDKTAIEPGTFSCIKGNSRHKNYIVNKELETNSYFIKQALGSSSEKIHSLQREGLFYQLAASEQSFEPLLKYLPVLKLHDNRNAILILEFLTDNTNLYEQVLNQQDLDTGMATTLSTILSILHSLSPETVQRLREQGTITVHKPWILTLPEANRFSENMGRSEAETAGLQLIYDIPGFVKLIEEASKLWEPTCLVHGDSKLHNFLFKPGKENDYQLKLIDWELFNMGDPLWDLATVFQSILTAWVINEDSVYKAQNGAKTFNIEKMQSFISACFANYAAAMNWNETETKSGLEKCTSFCGLRLLHNFFETTPHAESLRPYSARLLQLAYNILINPPEAAKQVLGIK